MKKDTKEKLSIAELIDELEKAEVIEKVIIHCKPRKKEAEASKESK